MAEENTRVEAQQDKQACQSDNGKQCSILHDASRICHKDHPIVLAGSHRREALIWAEFIRSVNFTR
jgi:hypothetical protein